MRPLKYLAAAPLAGLAMLTMPGLEAPAEAATKGRLCNVDHVAVISSRIHVKCTPNAKEGYTSDLRYYAMKLSEPRVKIDNIIKMAIESKRMKKPVRLWFDPNDYQSVPGCQGSNCRRLKGLALE